VSGGHGQSGARLGVIVDGAPLDEEQARALWQKFSTYMEEHKGDLGGFARAEGFVSVHPRSDGGRAVLVLSRSEPQEAYGVLPKPGAAPTAGKRRKRR
jgi:hypothetical protein